ncbi:hypothetical protein A5765_05115 [Mycolicibacterium celeriflavum]|uniref:hypothetical protein n=1 Tax=Mycolicibacterium celeriflavum TaxID=1249101 RepID=UPI00080100EC|nr:hypothetical protein [Mycolicibacterium celeriflavum]OBG17978.1 hypothetical protein A5765_05115 [Mycolicibacterium celeriflavum]
MDERPDNRLALVDHALFAGHRAAGLNLVMQCMWLHEHAIDMDGLKRFHHNLRYGLMGRRIECSPLPFARHRWVTDRGPSEIDVADFARPRTELSDWADERSQLPVDGEQGPGWHLGVLPLTDGSTAVSLVLSHYVIDGIGGYQVVADAVLGNLADLGYPPPHSRTRRRALFQDARQTAREVPEVGRALVAAARLARRARRDAARSKATPPPVALSSVDGDDPVVVPAVSMQVDLDEWDARAKALGANGKTLVAALAAKLAERLGRRRADDGYVTLHLPMNERTEGDTRANAISIASVSVDPARITTDLGDLRAAVKQALNTLRETPDESLQLRSLVPFMPKRALKRMVDAGLADPDAPALCSNLDEFDPIVYRPDGTDGEIILIRVIPQGGTREWLELTGGQMTLQSWRVAGGSKIYLTVSAYQPGVVETKPALHELIAKTLAEFELTGYIY